MNELRWILIGFGIILLAGIYLWGRRAGGHAADSDEAARVRPDPPLQSREPADREWSRESPRVIDQDSGDPRAQLAIEEPRIAAHRPAATRVETADPPPRATLDAASGQTKPAPPDTRPGRIEPTFSDSTQTEELPVSAEPTAPAPTLSSSDTPAPRRIERRKILSLRLAAAPQRLDGAKLLETLQSESLQHGKYEVFHRVHTDGVSIFSIASMVEPGTFDPAKMAQTQYPGITLFAQLPGPVPGMHALNELVACARRLQQALGGTLQDDRGVPLTVHRIERLRQEVREFERPPPGGSTRGHPVSHSAS